MLDKNVEIVRDKYVYIFVNTKCLQCVEWTNLYLPDKFVELSRNSLKKHHRLAVKVTINNGWMKTDTTMTSG